MKIEDIELEKRLKEKLLEKEKFIKIFKQVSSSYIKRMKNKLNDGDEINAIRRRNQREKLVNMIPQRKFEKLSFIERKSMRRKELTIGAYPLNKSSDKVIKNSIGHIHKTSRIDSSNYIKTENVKHSASTFLTGTEYEEKIQNNQRRIASSMPFVTQRRKRRNRRNRSKYHLDLDLKFEDLIQVCNVVEDQIKTQVKNVRSRNVKNELDFNINLKFKEDIQNESVKNTMKKLLVDQVGDIIHDSNKLKKKIKGKSKKDMKSKFITTKLLEHPVLKYGPKSIKLDHVTHI